MSGLNTFNDVLKVAIQKEEDAVDFYTKASAIVKESSTKEMLKEFIREEKRHIALLQDAHSNETMEKVGKKSLPQSMNLTKYLVGGTISDTSTSQDIMIIAMKKEESAIVFYSDYQSTFKGTGLEDLFQSLCNMEKEHKDRLELEYEKIFMPDN